MSSIAPSVQRLATRRPIASVRMPSIASVRKRSIAGLLGLVPALCLLLVLAFSPGARAHELQASIGDIAFGEGTVTIELRTNLEALIAGIGAEHDDTNDAPEASEYSRLRALAPEELRAALEVESTALLDAFDVRAGGTGVPLTIEEAEIDPVGDLAQARESVLTLTGALPAGADTVSVGLDPARGALILRGTGDNVEYGELLDGGARSQEIAVTGGTRRTALDVFRQYLKVGFDHILPLGLDHILFVIGLFLLDPRLRPLLWQVSAFTLAHTVTLALGATGLVRVSGDIVEPLIALSIVYVCVENVFSNGRLMAWRPVIIFAFGLLHGLGFASVFEEYGIPEGQFVSALLAFNIGVEIGQLTVIAACFLAVGLWFRSKAWYRSVIAVPASLVIAAIGLYWSLTRTGVVPEFLPYV